MKAAFVLIVAAGMLSGVLIAQEQKSVPKDSVRVYVPGCSRGMMFTVGPRTEDRPGGSGVPEGMHLRMNGPKRMMSEIKGQEGTMIEITGLMKKGQAGQDGVRIGGGIRIAPGSSPSGGSLLADPGAGQTMIDVEGWRRVRGSCPSK